ncbi:receptor-like serine/threonine kinase, partial [Trifolium medium]|nr:receptor-like serine/threonine kinase [Trifolium medium]
ILQSIIMPSRAITAPIRPSNGDVDFLYYVHPSEGPHSVNLTPQLNGSNYLLWSRSLQRALGAKNKLAYDDLLLSEHRIMEQGIWIITGVSQFNIKARVT